jgi:hypothetical protein
MTQPQVNQRPRCECPQCLAGRRKFGAEKFDAMTDDFLATFIQSMEKMATKEQSKPAEKVDEPKEDISLAEKYRLASIRKSTKDFDPEEDVWDEEDTMNVDDDIEPEWLKQETSAQLQQAFEAAEVSSLLTLVEAMRQQLYAAKRMNDATLSILKVLSEQL